MYRNDIELTIIQQINIYNGSRILANRGGVNSLVAYRINRNAELLEKGVLEFEQQRTIILKEFIETSDDGENLLKNEDGSFKFKSKTSKVDADNAIKELINTLGSAKFNVWFFEASEVDKTGEAGITGDIWSLIREIIVDNQ